ncbi:MAG: hypothetical protein QM742_09835 [Aquabacterium sp.]
MKKQDTQFGTQSRARVRVLSAGVALLCTAMAAHAAEGEDVPLYLTLTQQLQHDNNLLRQKENKAADIVSSTQLSVGLDKRLGRQHYFLDATVAKNKYRDYSKYDNDSYSGSGSFTTDIGSDFRLVADASLDRSLPAFEDSTLNRTVRNTRTSHNIGVDLRYGLYGRLSVNAGLRKSKTDFAETEVENKESTSVSTGLRYLPNELMYYGLTYTKTKTDFENRTFEFYEAAVLQNRIGEEVDSDNIGLGFAWQITGFSRFNGSIGYSRERNKYDKRRDFSGLTGAAGWRYTPTDKTVYKVNWSRDTNNSGSGSGAYDVKLGQFTVAANGYVATNRVIDSFSLGMEYELTSKIGLNASYSFIQYNEEKQSVIQNVSNSFSSRKSRYNALTLGGTYEPIRSVGLGCSLTFYDRTQSQFQEAYDGRTVLCYGSFTVQ